MRRCVSSEELKGKSNDAYAAFEEAQKLGSSEPNRALWMIRKSVTRALHEWKRNLHRRVHRTSQESTTKQRIERVGELLALTNGSKLTAALTILNGLENEVSGPGSEEFASMVTTALALLPKLS